MWIIGFPIQIIFKMESNERGKEGRNDKFGKKIIKKKKYFWKLIILTWARKEDRWKYYKSIILSVRLYFVRFTKK